MSFASASPWSRRSSTKAALSRKSPYRRAAILAVIKNPFAGRYVEEIVGFSDDLKPLGLDMARALIAALGGDPEGDPGLRQGRDRRLGWRDRARGALARPRRLCDAGGARRRDGDRAVRQEGRGAGARLDVPITHVNASYVRSHFDAIEVGVADAPRADEMLLALAMTTGPRVHNRAGGLEASQIKGLDGLR